MAEVWPFAGTRYATNEQAVDIAKVISPPYDEITPKLQKELHARDTSNLVRLVCGHEAASDDEANNRYSRSAECYRDWKARGILNDEQRKCFYVYQQQFTPEGAKKPIERLGFFALVKLQDFRSGRIRGHEITHESRKNDRLRLLRTTQINDSPLHMLYRDSEDVIGNVLREVMAKGQPTEDFVDHDGMHHRLWLMHKKDPILRIHEAMKPKRLYIADGHHRYETALKYRDEMREMTGRRDGRQPYDFTLMFLQRAEDDTLFTQPVHRVLTRELGLDIDIDEVLEDLEEYFNVREFKLPISDSKKSTQTIQEKIRPTKTFPQRFVMTLPNGRSWVLSLRKGADTCDMIEEETMSDELKLVDVVLLHEYIISRGWIGNPEVELDEDDIFYRRSIPDCLELLKKRKGCVAFFLNPMSKDGVLEVAENGELLPHNAVYFHPKIPCGLVMRDLNVGFG